MTDVHALRCVQVSRGLCGWRQSRQQLLWWLPAAPCQLPHKQGSRPALPTGLISPCKRMAVTRRQQRRSCPRIWRKLCSSCFQVAVETHQKSGVGGMRMYDLVRRHTVAVVSPRIGMLQVMSCVLGGHIPARLPCLPLSGWLHPSPALPHLGRVAVTRTCTMPTALLITRTVSCGLACNQEAF